MLSLILEYMLNGKRNTQVISLLNLRFKILFFECVCVLVFFDFFVFFDFLWFSLVVLVLCNIVCFEKLLSVFRECLLASAPHNKIVSLCI